MALKLTTYEDIYTAIAEALGIPLTDTTTINRIKRLVNLYYLDEVIPFKRWVWLQKTTKVVHSAYFNTDTASVTPASTSVTLSTAPSASLGSFAGYKFSIDGSGKVYEIASHTAGATAITLTSAYQEDLNATANYKIWRDRINLPTNAKETIEIYHANHTKPMDAVGLQGLRKLEAAHPKVEGFPTNYNVTDFYDPSTGDNEYESDRYRQVRIFPAITATPVTLNIDYIEEVSELSDDADEPAMPIGDRIVLYYGAGAMAWSLVARNEEMADKWQMKADLKISRMAGDKDEGFDSPSVSPKSGYINNIRRGGLRRRRLTSNFVGGQTSVTLPTYLRGVTIEGATITDTVTVDADVTIDGRDISADGALLDSLAASTNVTLTDNTANGVVATWAVAEVNTVHMNYSVIGDTADIEAGKITLVTDGTSASIAVGAAASLGTVGVTFTVDISGGNMRLLYTTTSNGIDREMNYQVFSWLVTQ